MTAPGAGQTTEARSWLSEGVVVAALPVLAYWIAFSYESGFASYFMIPPGLIQVSPQTLISALVAVVALIVQLAMLINLASFFWPDRPGWFANRLLRLSPALIMLVAIALARPSTAMLVTVGVAVAFFAFIEFLFPLLTQRRVVGYEAKLRAQDELDSVPQSLWFKTMRNPRSAGFYLVVFAVWNLVLLARLAGENAAAKQTVYPVVESIPGNPASEVVVAIYGDRFILAPVDLASRTIAPAYRVRSLDESRDMVLRPQTVGPFQVSDAAATVPKPLVGTP